MTQEPRYQIYRVGERDLCDLLAAREDLWFHLRLEAFGDQTNRPLPADAELHGVHHDFYSRSFALRYYHPSFPIVENGIMIPVAGTLRLDVELRLCLCEEITPIKTLEPFPVVSWDNHQDIKADMQRLADEIVGDDSRPSEAIANNPFYR